MCDGRGVIGERECEHCDHGTFLLNQCPRTFVGEEMTKAINLAGMCGKGDWPMAGGLFEQSAWFIDLKQAIEQERRSIQAEDEQNGT